ncbi:MAG: cytochrome c [Vicinamibacterales bacterium]
MNRFTTTAALLSVASAVLAAEGNFKLKQAPGVAQVQANCVACHSLDYIELNSRFLDRKGWEAEVTKMMKAFGAPVKEEDVPAIVDYLAKEYGKQ